MTRVIYINAKCSDMFSAELLEDDNPVSEYDGYVPSWFPSPMTRHYGDYVELKIDLDTGQILNWRRPTQKQLLETFSKPTI